jgi:aldose sugar dehydrogenase
MNKKSIYFGVLFIPIIGLGIYAWQYFGGDGQEVVSGEKVIMNASDTYDEEQKEKEPVELVVEEVVGGLEVPWSMVFASGERILVTERPGRIRAVENGVLQETPLYTFTEVSETGEEGLMGLALDPRYTDNRYVYVSLAYSLPGKMQVKVVRLTDNGDALIDPTTILDNIPAAMYHAGSRIAFGPDQRLYVTTGDATDKNIAQDMDSLGGKILRMNSDGSIPEDNPFEGSYVYSYGHRNPQGLAWNPLNNELYATEHGPSLFDGPAGGDEINHILPGENYGWPLVSHKEKKEGTEKPMLLFTPAVAPGGATFYRGTKIPQFTGKFLFAGLKGEGVYEVDINENDPNDVESYEKLAEVDFGRIRDIVEGPDEALYILTSNRDGRGKPAVGDDKIYRIRAK